MDGIQSMADFGFRIPDRDTGPHPPRPIRNSPSGPVERSEEKKEQVAKDFESVLLTKLFDQVQQSMGDWDLEEEGTGQQVQGLFWFYLARDAADKGGFGLWKDIYQCLQRMDAVPNPAESLNEEL